MTVWTLLLGWLALSVISALAYMMGASAGYRRGYEQATQPAHEGFDADAPPDLAVDIRLPDDAHHLR